MSGPSPLDRLRQTRRLLRSEGPAGVAVRVLSRAADGLTPAGYGSLPVSREDLSRASEILAGGAALPEPADWSDGEPLNVAWVCGPAGEGSGGHTTMFRMVAALERVRPHLRRLHPRSPWVGDRAASPHDPGLVAVGQGRGARPRRRHRGRACRLRDELGDRVPDARLPRRRGRRCYFVQDFEPSFYPAGSLALLAEATYRFGFHGVTAGRWLADLLRRDYGMSADHFDFGCDLEHYRLDAARDEVVERSGVCYFCRPSKPRRAHELAVVALDLFASRHPEVPIHTFGEPAGALPFRVIDHGLLDPEAARLALPENDRRARPLGDQRLAGPARDARRRLHPGGQRRRAQPCGPRQRTRRLRTRRRRSASPDALSAPGRRVSEERALVGSRSRRERQHDHLGREWRAGGADPACGREVPALSELVA